MIFESSAPGKVILFGEHAVVYGKMAIAASLNLRAKSVIELVPIKENEERMLSMKMPKSEDGKDLPPYQVTIQALQQLFRDETFPFKTVYDVDLIREWSERLEAFVNMKDDISSRVAYASIAYVALMIEELSENKIYKNAHIRVVLSTELPMGAGLGSSASFAVSLVGAFLSACLQWTTSDQLDEKQLELVNQWAFVVEKIIHGTPSGIDNTVATYGGLLTKEGSTRQIVHDAHPCNILIVNTMVPKNTKALVAGVRSRYEDEKTSSKMKERIDSIDSLSKTCLSILTSTPFDEVYFQKLITQNHELLNAIGVGHPQLEVMVSIANQYQLVAKLTGAGGGGCGFIYLPANMDSPPSSLLDDLHQAGFWVELTKVGAGGVAISVS